MPIRPTSCLMRTSARNRCEFTLSPTSKQSPLEEARSGRPDRDCRHWLALAPARKLRQDTASRDEEQQWHHFSTDHDCLPQPAEPRSSSWCSSTVTAPTATT